MRPVLDQSQPVLKIAKAACEIQKPGFQIFSLVLGTSGLRECDDGQHENENDEPYEDQDSKERFHKKKVTRQDQAYGERGIRRIDSFSLIIDRVNGHNASR